MWNRDKFETNLLVIAFYEKLPFSQKKYDDDKFTGVKILTIFD